MCAVGFLRLEEMLERPTHEQSFVLEPQGLLHAKVHGHRQVATRTTLLFVSVGDEHVAYFTAQIHRRVPRAAAAAQTSALHLH